MKVGTKSLLFGAHQFIIHPLFVALGWWVQFGFPWDPRLWCAFFLHDIGYFGRGDIDGEEGEGHVWLGASIMGYFFGPEWREFTLLHSRYTAKALDKDPSALCRADKMAFVLMPTWFYVIGSTLTGELEEYRQRYNLQGRTRREVVRDAKSKVQRWLEESILEEKIDWGCT